MDKLVSIVIPTHKGTMNLNRAVQSAFNQTYSNIEIIVVDDNGLGTDEQIKTQQIMSQYLQNKNVIYIPHEVNRNGSAARNTGINTAKGDYIAFLDDDDEFMPNNIEEHINRFREVSDEYAITYCGMRLYAGGKSPQEIMPPSEGNLLYDFLCGKIRIGSSLIVVKKSVVDEINGFDESFLRHQDWEFIVRILNNYKIAKVDNVGVQKYNLGRNNAPNPLKFEKNRLHYLNKMEYIIKKFSVKQQKEIYAAHYSTIAKEYLKVKNIKSFMYWTLKTGRPVKYLCKYFTDAITYMKKK